MLYTKPIDQIAWNNIESFCQQRIAEGAYLDYKVDFPANLEKTIAAMANTLGGIILIGVEEDNENKPKVPIRGIAFKRGLSERVTNIILSNIAPPVFPEIVVCPDSTEKQAVVVVRIPQSDQTPHAITGNTMVYLRTGNRNKPELLARRDEIEWLQNKRRKSEQLRNSLYNRADGRFTDLSVVELRKAKYTGTKLDVTMKGCLTVSLCPLYPKQFFRTPPELLDVQRKIQVNDYYGPSNKFPLSDISFPPRIVQDGVIQNYFVEENIQHTELNCFGLYFYKQTLARKKAYNSRVRKVIWASEILCRLDEFFDSAVKYYTQLGYWGLLHFRFYLDDIRGHVFEPYVISREEEEVRSSLDKEVGFCNAVLAGKLEEEKSKLILEVATRVAWAFDWKITNKHVDMCYQQYKRKQ